MPRRWAREYMLNVLKCEPSAKFYSGLPMSQLCPALRAQKYGPRHSAASPHRARRSRMTPDRWQLIKDLFATAVDLDECARGAWLDERCRGDEALRVEVDSLLLAHTSSDATLDTPAKDRAGLNRLKLVDVLKEQQATLPRFAKNARPPRKPTNEPRFPSLPHNNTRHLTVIRTRTRTVVAVTTCACTIEFGTPAATVSARSDNALSR